MSAAVEGRLYGIPEDGANHTLAICAMGYTRCRWVVDTAAWALGWYVPVLRELMAVRALVRFATYWSGTGVALGIAASSNKLLLLSLFSGTLAPPEMALQENDLKDISVDVEEECRIPKIVRRYVQDIQLKLGVLEHTPENEGMVRKTLSRMFDDPDHEGSKSLRRADKVRYTEEIVARAFIPSDDAMFWRLAPKACPDIAAAQRSYNALRPKKQ